MAGAVSEKPRPLTDDEHECFDEIAERAEKRRWRIEKGIIVRPEQLNAQAEESRDEEGGTDE